MRSVKEELTGIIKSHALHKFPDGTVEVQPEELANHIRHYLTNCAAQNLKDVVEQYEAYRDDVAHGRAKWQIIERCFKWLFLMLALTPLFIAALRNSLSLN